MIEYNYDVDISATVEEVGEEGKVGIFVDVGSNVAMANFAAAAMWFWVLAFEPVVGNSEGL